MLVSFSVTNFRSIGEEVTLNMVASNKLSDHPNHLVPIGDTGKHVLRAAVIYGANAAGKSNLIKAMDVARRLICESGAERRPIAAFRFRIGEPALSSFEFRFMVGAKVFVYGFDFQAGKYPAEWLAVVKGEEEIVLFERQDSNVEVADAGRKLFPNDRQTFEIFEALQGVPLRHDQLFLSRAITAVPEELQGETLRSIIKWFTTDLIVLPASSRSIDILDRLYDDQKFRLFCARFLNSVGTGVGGLKLETLERELTEWERRRPREPQRRRFGLRDDMDIIPKPDNPDYVIERKLFGEHFISDSKFHLPFSEESDGTQALLHLMPILASAPDETHVVVIDELDRSLHPLLCWEFVRFFSESCEGARRQLIVTTHEAHLLNQELLRRDEYWFAEKDDSQQTRLVSLLDFKIRNDLKVDKGYLSGRFGAIPIIGGMGNLERLLECEESEADDATEESAT